MKDDLRITMQSGVEFYSQMYMEETEKADKTTGYVRENHIKLASYCEGAAQACKKVLDYLKGENNASTA